MRQATVVRIPTMPSINPTKRRLWEYIFPEETEGHWSSLQGAMIGLDFSDILGPHPGHWSDTQEAI